MTTPPPADAPIRPEPGDVGASRTRHAHATASGHAGPGEPGAVSETAWIDLYRIEATTGRKPGRKQVRDLREDTRMALLPLAFTKQATQSVWIDPRAGLPCPPETALARLSDPEFAMGGPALRLLAKAQGALAGHAWIWRR